MLPPWYGSGQSRHYSDVTRPQYLWNHHQPDCLFKSVFIQTTGEISKVLSTGTLWGEYIDVVWALSNALSCLQKYVIGVICSIQYFCIPLCHTGHSASRTVYMGSVFKWLRFWNYARVHSTYDASTWMSLILQVPDDSSRSNHFWFLEYGNICHTSNDTFTPF